MLELWPSNTTVTGGYGPKHKKKNNDEKDIVSFAKTRLTRLEQAALSSSAHCPR